MKTKNIGEVRIIAGMHKGKRLTVPKTNQTRPTAGRVRESMFNILEHNDWGLKDKSILIGANVLDIFSGSGALGLEALSRGAKNVLFLENNKDARESIEINILKLNESKHATILPRDATKPGPPYNKKQYILVFADPPYGSGLATPALSALVKEKWLFPGALIVLEIDITDNFQLSNVFKVLNERRYGRKRIMFLQWDGGNNDKS